MYLTVFTITIKNIYKELKKKIASVKKWIGNLNRKMKVLKMQKKNSTTEMYNRIYIQQEERAEESLKLKIN